MALLLTFFSLLDQSEAEVSSQVVKQDSVAVGYGTKTAGGIALYLASEREGERDRKRAGGRD